MPKMARKYYDLSDAEKKEYDALTKERFEIEAKMALPTTGSRRALREGGPSIDETQRAELSARKWQLQEKQRRMLGVEFWQEPIEEKVKITRRAEGLKPKRDTLRHWKEV